MNLFTKLLSEKKDQFTKKTTEYVKIREGGGYCETCWYPSEYGYVEKEEIDWELLQIAMKELEESFKPGGENAGRNPLNKDGND